MKRRNAQEKLFSIAFFHRVDVRHGIKAGCNPQPSLNAANGGSVTTDRRGLDVEKHRQCRIVEQPAIRGSLARRLLA